MIRSRVAHLKGLLFAALTMLLIFSGVEWGLRIRSATCNIGQSLTSEELVVPSWTTFQSLRPGRSNESSGAGGFFVNSFGTRGPEPAVPKPANLFRIVFLGDEFVLQAEQRDQDTICRNLEESLRSQSGRSVEVLNAGTPGFSPILSYLKLRHDLLILRPDLVLINISPSDVLEERRLRRHTIIDSLQGPLACPHPNLLNPRLPNTARRFCDELRTIRWVSDQLGEWIQQESEPKENLMDGAAPSRSRQWQPEEMDVLLAPIAFAKKLTDSIGADLVVTVSPPQSDEAWVEVSRRIVHYLNEREFGTFAVAETSSQGLLRQNGANSLSEFRAQLTKYLLSNPRLTHQNRVHDVMPGDRTTPMPSTTIRQAGFATLHSSNLAGRSRIRQDGGQRGSRRRPNLRSLSDN